MAMGIAVRTTAESELTPLEELAGVAMYAIININSVNGSTSIPGWNSPGDGNFFIVNNHSSMEIPAFIWNNSTKVLTWWNASSTSDRGTSNNLTVYCLRT